MKNNRYAVSWAARNVDTKTKQRLLARASRSRFVCWSTTLTVMLLIAFLATAIAFMLAFTVHGI